MSLINRTTDTSAIISLLEQFPITAILGPRQCGKTTLVKTFAFDHFFDLENPRDLRKMENPQLALEDLKGLIVIDEIQRKSELFPLLRFLVDNNKEQKFLILGSASRELIKQGSESLAGRIAFYELRGFGLDDVGSGELKKLWVRGGLPLSFLAEDDTKSLSWRDQYVTGFLERDIPQLGISIPAATLRRFWLMLCDLHGQVMNYSEMGRAFGISDMTVRQYLDILQGTFMVRIFQPWHANITKRQVRNPKIYIRDSGLYHSLLTLENENDIFNSVKLGLSWEGFALEQAIRAVGKRSEEVFFWKTHSGAELDLFWRDKGMNLGIEFKFSDAPGMTKSLGSAVSDLELEHLWVVYPGKDSYRIHEKITVLPLKDLISKPEFGTVMN